MNKISEGSSNLTIRFSVIKAKQKALTRQALPNNIGFEDGGREILNNVAGLSEGRTKNFLIDQTGGLHF